MPEHIKMGGIKRHLWVELWSPDVTRSLSRHSRMPSWRVGGPIQSQPAQFQLDSADFRFLENNLGKHHIVSATCFLEDMHVSK